jgi:hypothetical protein
MGNLSGALQQLRAERKQAQGTPYAQSRYVAPRLSQGAILPYVLRLD